MCRSAVVGAAGSDAPGAPHLPGVPEGPRLRLDQDGAGRPCAAGGAGLGAARGSLPHGRRGEAASSPVACEGGKSRQREGRRGFPGQRHTLGCPRVPHRTRPCHRFAFSQRLLPGSHGNHLLLPHGSPPNLHRCVRITASVSGARPPQMRPGAAPVLRRPKEPLSALYHQQRLSRPISRG